MNFFGSVLAFVLLPLIAGALYWGGVFANRATAGKISSGWASIALLALLLLAIPLLLDFTGQTVGGVMIAKDESIETGRYSLTPPVYHHFVVTVAPSAADGSELIAVARPDQLAVSASIFDRLRVGQNVNFRELSLGPVRIARLADTSFLYAFPIEQFDRIVFAIAWPFTIVALISLAVAPQFALRGRLVIAGMALAASLLDCALLRAWWIPRPANGQAKIAAVETVRVADVVDWFSLAQAANASHVVLPRAYDEVQLQFHSASDAGIVTAVDRIDIGTAGKLAAGQAVDIAYNSYDPRDARLKSGTRSYVWRNPLVYYGTELGLLAVFLLISAGAKTFGQRIKAFAEKRRAERQ